MRLRWLIVCMVLMLSPLASLAATRYMATNGSDGNSCDASQSQSTPKRNLNGASGAMACMAGGDTLIVRAGTYNERIAPFGNALPNGLGENQRTTIAGYPGEVVQFGPAGGTVFDLGGGAGFSYMTFENFIIDAENYNPSGPRGANFGWDTHHIRFKNMTVRNAVVNIEGRGSYHEFLNCRVYGAYYYGWYWSGDHTLIDGNEIFNNTEYAIHLFSAVQPPEPPAEYISNNIIRNNRIYGNGFGHDGAGGAASPTVIMSHGHDNAMYNNLIYNNDWTGIQVNSYCFNCQAYNNTIVNNRGPGVDIGNDNVFDSVVLNNIFSGNGTPILNQGANSTMNNNLCQSGDTGCTFVGDPAFEDSGAGNFKLTAGSAARNRIATSGGVCKTPTDFANTVTRPQTPVGGSSTPCDVGAYEYDEGNVETPPSGNPVYLRSVGSDSNDCTAAENPATAKRHFLGAQGALSCMTVPGKVLYVEGNGAVYSEEIDTSATAIRGGNGPSFDTATRIEGYGSPLPILRSPAGATTSGSGVLLYIRAANNAYLIVKKLIIDGNNDTYNTVVVAGPAHHIRFDQVEVKNTLTLGFEGVYLLDTSNIELIDTFVHDTRTSALTLDGTVDGLLCQRCHLFNATRGVNVTSAGTKTNVTVSETEVRNNSGDGIDLNAGAGTLLQNLLVHSNGGRGVWIHGGASGTRAFNSTLYGNTGVGLQCDTGATSSAFRNNIVYGNTGGNMLNNCGATVAKNLCAAASADCPVFGDPLFVAAPTNLRLGDGSPGINQGETIASILTDYGGQPRRQGQQDIGAWERTEGGPPAPGILRVSAANPRYFENQSGDIVYLTGAYSWNFASTMPDAEVTAYLNYAVAHNHNYLRAPSQDYDGSGQSTDYFTVLAARVNQAAALGVYVGVNVFPSLTTVAPFNNLAFDEAYARSLVRAVGSAPNVLYEVGNELETQALDGGTLGFFMNRIVDVINDEQAVQGFTPRRMVSISDFRATGASYVVNSAVVSFLLSSHADFVQIGFSQANSGACDIIPDYGGQKVSMPDSDHIEAYHCDYVWVWKMLMNGGNPTLLEGNAFFPDHTEPDNPGDTTGATITYEARIRMGDTKTYANKLHLNQAVPHPELSSTGYALAWPGEEYLVYQPAVGSFTVTLLAGEYAVEWFDPTARTTLTAAPLTVASAGAQTFSTPITPAHDAVLFLKATPVMPPEPAVTVRYQDLGQTGWYF